MKTVLGILFLILLILKLISSSLQPNNYCLKSTNKCIGKYKKSCGSDFCSVNSEACTHLVKHKFYIEEILNPKPQIKHMIYEKFINLIANCSSPPNPIEYSLNHVCIRKINCIKKNSPKLATKCMCSARTHLTQCGQRYCASSQKSCHKFKSTISKKKSVLLEIKYCA
jgi:hypothetical protein